MRKWISLVGLGFLGLSALQGCAASISSDEAESLGKTEDAVNSCYTQSGLMPTKAALAVAMATELGRWEPAKDLVSVTVASMPRNNGLVVQLSPSAVCVKNSCANTKAILGQQDLRINDYIDQNVFSANTFNTDLVNSLGRQANLLSDLKKNNPGKLPPIHKLTLVGGPTDLGIGACGPHYVYQADHSDGTPLTSTEATNLGNDLCMFGYGDCGSYNGYIKYTVTGQGCPSGRTCIAVDPADGDNTSTTTTGAGGIPTYPMNRVYNPDNSLLNSACTTSTGKVTTLVSKCTAQPNTCGYLYCV